MSKMPIVLSHNEWARLQKWTTNDVDAEMASRREYINYLDKTSRAMTKSWPNSLENVNKRNEELRQARIAAAEQANTKFYKRYLKRKKAEQERLMFNARDMVFKDRDAPKLLLSAVIETAIQKERGEQLKFLEECRSLEVNQKRKDDERIIEQAKTWHAHVALQKQRRFEANKQHQKDILDQANEIAERKRKEYEEELNQQKIDNIKANSEMDAVKVFEENFKKQEKARILRDIEQANKEANARKHEQLARDKMDDRLIEVLLRSRARVEAKRKKTEQDLKEEKHRVLEQISKKLESGDAAREAREQAILDKAIKEKENADEIRRRKDIEKKERYVKERKDARAKFLREEAQRLHEFNTMRQWEVMNRFKNAELCEDFKEKLCLENERKIKEYREDILKLWKERTDREAQELAEQRHFYGPLAEQKVRAGDNRVLAHAAHLLQECAQLGRPAHALHRTIDKYCKMHRLYPMPHLPKSMQEHFQGYSPWDGSKPDPDYEEPPEPPPPTPPKPLITDSLIETQRDEEKDKRDGMQVSPKAGTSKAADKPLIKRADGLQKRNPQPKDSLPPVTVIPCPNPNCSCELKP